MLGNYSKPSKKLGLAMPLVIAVLLPAGLAHSIEEGKITYSGSQVNNDALQAALKPCRTLLADWLKMSSVTRSSDSRKQVDECYQKFLDDLISQLSVQKADGSLDTVGSF